MYRVINKPLIISTQPGAFYCLTIGEGMSENTSQAVEVVATTVGSKATYAGEQQRLLAGLLL